MTRHIQRKSKWYPERNEVKAPRDKGLIDLWRYERTRHMIIMWTPTVVCLIIAAIWLSNTYWLLPLGAFIGLLVYSLVEYIAHRWVYHDVDAGPVMSKVTDGQATEHLKHHRRPARYNAAINGRQRPILALVLLLAIAFSFLPVLRPEFLMGLAFGAAGYVGQEFMHFATHHFPMRGPILERFKRHHMLHHYQDENSNYGILFSWWDIAFGTEFHRKVRRLKRAREAAAAATSPASGG